MDAAHGTRRQLGRLLVEKGVLSETQLELALAEQQGSGRPLGEVVVSLGFASGAVVGNALAEQHGGPLRTEYGFAAGPMRTAGGGSPPQAGTVRDELGEEREMTPVVAPVEQRVAPEPQPRLEEKQPVEALVEAMPPTPPHPVSAPPAEPVPRSPINTAAEIPAGTAPLVPHEGLSRAAELASPSSDSVTALAPDDTNDHPRTPDSVIVELRAALEEQATVLASTQTELAEAAADISRAAHERKELDLTVENQEAELREQAAMLARTEAELAEAKVEVARAGRERDELELALRAAEVELQDLAASEPEAMKDAASDEHHLLFFPGSRGYSMVERSGPAPTAGGRVDVVDTDGVATPFVVMKVGRSPLPSFGGPCAFLAP